MPNFPPIRPDARVAPTDLDLSVATGMDESMGEDEERRGLTGWVGKVFRLPWANSEPADHDRGRELRRAVRAEDLSKVRRMLREGVGVNESQEASLACIATRRRNLVLLQILIAAGVDLNQGDQRNRASRVRTPLQEASRKGWLEGIETMLGAGAEVDRADDVGATALVLAVRAGQTAASRRLLAAGARPDGDGTGRAIPLHEATTPELGQALLDAGASLTAVDRAGAAALHAQARVGRWTMVDFLLSAGAPPDLRDGRGRTALFQPGNQGDVGAVFDRLLDAGADPAARDRDENTFLHMAATRCIHARVLDALHRRCPKGWDRANRDGETPVHLLATRGFGDLAASIRSALERAERREQINEPRRCDIFRPEA